MNFRIFVEGKSDQKFLRDFILKRFGIELQAENFDPLGSWSGYKSENKLKASIRENSIDNNKTSLLILDGDTDWQARKLEIFNDFKSFGVDIELFLFPDNQSNGNLEDILAEIAVERKLIECFQNYEKCVDSYPKKLNHSRIYSYLDMILQDEYLDDNKRDLRREEFRDFCNENHWDLNHSCLNPLFNFLDSHINIKS